MVTDSQFEAISKLLDRKINKVYEYKGNRFRILSYFFPKDKDNVVVRTDESMIHLPCNRASNILTTKFVEIATAEVATVEPDGGIIQQSNNVFAKAETAVLGMIDKIQADPAIIPQAQSLCQAISTLMDIKKTQIAATKFLSN
jgi:hypothetical protein